MQTGGFVFSHLIRWHEGMGLKSSVGPRCRGAGDGASDKHPVLTIFSNEEAMLRKTGCCVSRRAVRGGKRYSPECVSDLPATTPLLNHDATTPLDATQGQVNRLEANEP